MYALGKGSIPGGLWTTAANPVLNVCVRYIGVLAGLATDEPGNKNGGVNGAGVNRAGVEDVTVGKGLVGEVSLRARDFQWILQKLELTSWVILYKSKFSFSSHVVFLTSIKDVGSFSSNMSYSDLAIQYFCYLGIYTPNFCK